ncbi:MAG TPA: hypothetical protein VFQ44_02410 [Streptosporangiaceae bacterium]|nr:hypothetical protein [Streptosporangiaceae bacterium]
MLRSTCPCGKPKSVAADYCRDCVRRWERAGWPDSGPPAPMSSQERGTRIAQGLRPDPYDRLWAAELEPRRRMHRAVPVAAHLVRCVAVRDAEGVRRLLYRYADLHWSLPVSLAVTASPVLAAMIARTAPEVRIRRAARTACELIPAVAGGDHARAGVVIRLRASSWESYAALAIVLAESVTSMPAARAA